MSKMKLLVLACTLLISLSSAAAFTSEKRRRSSSLLLPKPDRMTSKSSAGRLLSWADAEAFEELHAGAAIIELEENGMAMPMYTNVHTMCYVLEGRAEAGLIKPNGEATNVRYVRVGDVVVVPSGWAFWIWNEGRMQMRAFCASNAQSSGDMGDYKSFLLAGGAEKGESRGILHGFSEEVLATMWEMSAEEAQEILRSQNESGFIHAENSLKPSNDEEYGDFVFNMDTARPDHRSLGGSLTLLGGSRMPVLENLELGALKARLQSTSMFAPQWSSSNGQIIYVTRGKGRVEISSHDGEQLLAERVEEGDVFVVPPMHPHVVVNEENAGVMEWVCIHLSSKFMPNYLAGSKSVFNSMPVEALAATFNVSVELADELQTAREYDDVMFEVELVRVEGV